MQIELMVSEDFSADDIAELLHQLSTDQIPVVESGTYQRRASGDLPPILWITLGVALPIGTGFLSAIGETLWRSLQERITTALKLVKEKRRPSVTFEVRFSDDAEITLYGLGTAVDIPSCLDKAVQRIAKPDARNGISLWWNQNSDEWLTLDEYLASQSRSTITDESSADQRPT